MAKLSNNAVQINTVTAKANPPSVKVQKGKDLRIKGAKK